MGMGFQFVSRMSCVESEISIMGCTAIIPVRVDKLQCPTNLLANQGLKLVEVKDRTTNAMEAHLSSWVVKGDGITEVEHRKLECK
jgi:hypothetical protein